MKHFSVGRFPPGLLVLWLLSMSLCVGEEVPASVVARDASPNAIELSQPPRVTASARGHQLAYVGVYQADGKYEPVGKHRRWYNHITTEETAPGSRPSEIPPSVNLHPRAYSIENFQPPYHAVKELRGQSRVTSWRDDVMTFLYGHEKLLGSPRHMTTDSKGRIIISDPGAGAVHVLDEQHSFRIATGANRRLLNPDGIAVDAKDNIYVADSSRGVVVVFDADGTFLRSIGELAEHETLFHHPTDVALDRTRGHLYVLDSERHLIFLLDLQGNVLRRIGRFQGNDVVVDFEFPTHIVLGNEQLAVLDVGGSRVSVLDLDGNLRQRFAICPVTSHGIIEDFGLAMDADSHIYVSKVGNPTVRLYDGTGKLISSFQAGGKRPGETSSPGGLWIDSGSRLYVADQFNRRIEVFQLNAQAAGDAAAGK